MNYLLHPKFIVFLSLICNFSYDIMHTFKAILGEMPSSETVAKIKKYMDQLNREDKVKSAAFILCIATEKKHTVYF